MRRLLLTIAILSPGCLLHSNAEWFTVYGSGKPAKTITMKLNGGSRRLPLYEAKLQVTDLILRRDNERAGYYWLEATLTEIRDSDVYLFTLDDNEPLRVYTRGDKWAVGFESLDLARRALDHLKKLHKLKLEHVRDATKA